MNLAYAISLYGGGPGSGCNPTAGKCGRPTVNHELTQKPVPTGGDQRYNKLAQEFKDEVKKQGYDPKKVRIVPPGGGHQYDKHFNQNALASANSKTGVIDFTPELTTTENIKGIVAHELMHFKMHKYIDAHLDELKAMTQDEIRKKALADGVSQYSFEVWKKVLQGDMPLSSGFQETLAEMARLETETGKVPATIGKKYGGDDAYWQGLYKEVKNVKLG